MRSWRDVRLLLVILIVAASLAPAASRAGEETVQIGWLSRAIKRTLPLSYLDQPPQDEGIQGARLGIADNETTGHFTGQSFTLTEAIVPEDGDVAAGLRELAAKGIRLVVTDLAAPELLSVAGMPEAAGITFFDAGSADDRLRGEDCRANILHLLPSRAMLADALVQYLVAKRWQDLLLVVGHGEGDREFAGDIRHAALKFQARIVQEKPWTFVPGRAPDRYRPFRDPGRGRALHTGHQLRRSGRRRRRGRVRRRPLLPHLRPAPGRRNPRSRADAPGRGRTSNGARPSCRIASCTRRSAG